METSATPPTTTTSAELVRENPVELRSTGLSAFEVVTVARKYALVSVGPSARDAIATSASFVEAMALGEHAVYGVSTGFGSLATTVIPAPRREELQRALIRSHAAGMGPLVEPEVVRAMMVLRARTLSMGYSGVRQVVVDTIVSLLNANIIPPVHEHGSLGASGDLAPLSAVALALIGEGECAPAMRAAGIAPVTLRAKEGLALINGTDGMLGMLVLALNDLDMLVKVADISAAVSIEALMGTDRAFAADVMALRPHPGQTNSAANLRQLLANSEIMASHRSDDVRVQDAYSLRCTPQVHGAARDTIAHARRVADIELGSAIDNPSVMPDGRVESCGHFHGAPVGFACDFLAIACAEIGAIAERRTDRLLDRNRSHGLPPFLAEDAGVNSGMMIAHYTQAAMVAENRRLAAPASVDSLPTSAMQEDHVSMGWGAARKLRCSIANLGRILAAELVCAARGVDLRGPVQPSPPVAAAVAALRAAGIGGPGPDRWLAPELGLAESLVMSGDLLAAVEAIAGPLL
jgi:histidine ammonia-lyase